MPPPPVSPTDYTLYVPEGFAYTQYQTANREWQNPDNPMWARTVFFGLGVLAGPLALAEEHIARPVANVPFVMYNAGVGIGEHTGRAMLWAEQGEYAEATLEGLYAVRDTSTGVLAGLSVAVPISGAIESRTSSTVVLSTTESRIVSSTMSQTETRVVSWAEAGIAPDLNPGRWVMIGEPTRFNFIRSGLIGPKADFILRPPFLTNIRSSNVPFNNYVTGQVPTSSLYWPPGLEAWKGILGQRVIR
jgi:hypothetical protein